MWLSVIIIVLVLLIVYLGFSLIIVEVFYNKSLVRPKQNKKKSSVQKDMEDELFNDERRKEFKIAYEDIITSSEEVEILNDKGERVKSIEEQRKYFEEHQEEFAERIRRYNSGIANVR